MRRWLLTRFKVRITGHHIICRHYVKVSGPTHRRYVSFVLIFLYLNAFSQFFNVCFSIINYARWTKMEKKIICFSLFFDQKQKKKNFQFQLRKISPTKFHQPNNQQLDVYVVIICFSPLLSVTYVLRFCTFSRRQHTQIVSFIMLWPCWTGYCCCTTTTSTKYSTQRICLIFLFTFLFSVHKSSNKKKQTKSMLC